MIVLLILLSSLISHIICCNCDKTQSLDRQLCRSDFAAKLWIRSSRRYLDYSNASYYRVRLVALPYKLGQWAEVGLSRGRLYTNSSEEECGRNFARNRVYVVTGSIDRQRNAWTSLCDYNRLSDEVSDQDMTLLLKGVNKNDCNTSNPTISSSIASTVKDMSYWWLLIVW